MKKRPTKTRTTAEKVSAAELEAIRQQQLLRRLRNQQRTITSLARDVTRAVRRADVARLEVARELCADTGWNVFEVAEIDRRERDLEAAHRNERELLLRVEELQSERELAGQR